MQLEERVRSDLAARTRFGDIRLLDSTDSTNRVVAAEAAAGAPEGLVVSADWQSAGRGRLDRKWDAAPGDALLVSVLLRPAGLGVDRWHLATAAVALAARQACQEVAGVSPDIKWPNDLLLAGAKLAGVLAEAAGGALVVGMGLNVHAGPPGSAVLEAAAAGPVRRPDLLVAWLLALEPLLGDWEAVADRYGRECATVGRDVEVQLAGGGKLVGRAERVEPAGGLVVVSPDGSESTVTVGDVTHLRGAH